MDVLESLDHVDLHAQPLACIFPIFEVGRLACKKWRKELTRIIDLVEVYQLLFLMWGDCFKMWE